MYRIHIVGAGPRTGTTLMHEAIKVCFDIDTYCDHEHSILFDPTQKREIYLSKHPNDVLVARLLMRVNPKLYFICFVTRAIWSQVVTVMILIAIVPDCAIGIPTQVMRNA